MGAPGDLSGIRSKATLEAMQEVGKDTAAEIRAERATAKQNAQAANTQTAFRPKTKTKKKSLKNRASSVTKMMKAQKEKRLLPVKRIEEKADQFNKRNPELKVISLKQLRALIKPGMTKEQILETVKNFYHDVSLQDEVLEFLMETTEGELYNTVKEAKEELNEKMGREITAGRNIGHVARQAAEKGLGPPTSLRDMYRDITGNPREPNNLFEELASKYAYKDLKKVISFLLHSMGADMKAKGPSIAHGMLYRLINETRTLQAILGVFRFFHGRMGLVKKMFAKEGLNVPKQLTFENMAKQFMALASDRYPSADKVLQRAVRLGIEDWILAKIIAFSQFRDSIRELALSKIYRSLQHRDELLMAIIEALEDLEDELEEEEEEEE